MAEAHGLALTAVTGTGPRGRIKAGDVAAHAGLPLPARRERVRSAPVESPKGAATTRSLSRLQQTIAARMAEAKATIPHFQVQTEVHADALLALRAQMRDEATVDPVPSVNDLIVKASALALREFPLANGSFRDDRFELYERINIGIAVAAEEALVVPVITDADTRPLAAIAVESRRLADRVREGSVTPAELVGGTFTVSNLGMFGMTAIYPVINPGQAAILGVGASRAVPVVRGTELSEQQLITLTLSCDHRILYGVEAARFLKRVATILERPLQLLL
jgi:pyruvate dehydrogenase E2 component (dihydrolipoamide acetyltransferase)